MSLDDRFRFEDLVAVEDREPAWILADALVLRVLASIPSLTLRKVASFMATRCCLRERGTDTAPKVTPSRQIRSTELS